MMVAGENEVVMRDVTNAGLVVSDRIGREIAGQLDLEEALEASRYSSHPYSTHPSEWPPLAEVVNTWELPPVLIERYTSAGGEETALCGIFPEIRRAWASVDNSLFLWRFDKCDGQCPEFSGVEQAICAVGLSKAKNGVFIEAIQYILVLATPAEICLEMLYFASCSDDADSSIVREVWARLIDQALTRVGIAEACAVLKRVGSHVYPGDGAILPFDTLCLHLEKAAQERTISGVEPVGDEDIARALLAACKGAIEPVLNTYDQLLSSGVILPSPSLRLCLLRSVLTVLREWALSVFAQKMGTTSAGASMILGGPYSMGQTTFLNQGVRDKITSAANRYMTEVWRLSLPQNLTETVYRGFRELEESLLSRPFSF